MRIGVDAHVLSGKFQGSRTYLLNLYKQVLKHRDVNSYHFFGHWDQEKPYGKDAHYVDFKSGSKLKRLTYETHPLLVENQIAWYHTTYISPLRIPCQSVVTIHDILFETHPQFFTKQEVWRNKLLVRLSARKAAQIHTVSEYSKNALIELYGILESKIHLVPNGVDLERYSPKHRLEAKAKVLQKYGVKDFILIVGRIEPRKNHIALLKAYKQLLEKHAKVGKLVIAGKPDFLSQPFYETLKQLGIEEKVLIIDSVDDDTLPDMYRAAKLFVYPSYAEGFGIPPLEAMACGVPVITSNTTALPEVVGSAGVLIDPRDPNQLARAMEEVLGNPELQRELSLKGIEQSKKWNWENSARAYLDAIESLARRS